MRVKWIVAVLALGLMTAGISRAADDKADAIGRLDRASKTLDHLTEAPDRGIPDGVIKGAKCIAIVPNLTKGGFILAAQHGRGVATCKLPDGNWSAPAFFSISGGSWGPQIGVEDTHLVIFVMTDEGARHMLNDKFQIGGDASAAVGPLGRTASAGTDWKANTELLTYSRSKGLFAGIDLGGSWVERDKDSNRAFYGKDWSNSELLNGKVPPPPEARAFLDEISGVRTQAAR